MIETLVRTTEMKHFMGDLHIAAAKSRPIETFRFPIGLDRKDIVTFTTPWPLTEGEFAYLFRVLEIMKPGLVVGCEIPMVVAQ